MEGTDMSETVLVTGGAGFIGSHLVDALLDRGHHVRIFDSLEPQVHGALRERGEWPAYLAADCQRVLGDVRDRDALRRALDGVSLVYHHAALLNVGQSMSQVERYVDVNVRGTAVLLDVLLNDASIRSRVRKLVVASSTSIYGEGKYSCSACGIVNPGPRDREQLQAADWEVRCPNCGQVTRPLAVDEGKPLGPASIYALSKRDQEEMCLMIGRTYGIATVALRYFNVYGPRQALANPYTGVVAIFMNRLLNAQSPVIFEDGRQSRDFVHVSDVVRANLWAIESDEMAGHAFNVGTGRPLTVLEIAQALAVHTGSGAQPQLDGQFRAGDVRHSFADISRIRALGYQPGVHFEDGVAELAGWLRENEDTR
jgi:dTDP-L-rhamnose 4-epimerase